MEEIIKLGNRYNAKNFLEKSGDNRYVLRFENDEEGSYCRVGLLEGHSWEDNEYFFVDPSGGPFLSIGSEISEGVVINRITSEEEGGKHVYVIYVVDHNDK